MMKSAKMSSRFQAPITTQYDNLRHRTPHVRPRRARGPHERLAEELEDALGSGSWVVVARDSPDLGVSAGRVLDGAEGLIGREHEARHVAVRNTRNIEPRSISLCS